MLLWKSRMRRCLCAASALTDEEQEMTLEQFMKKWNRKIQKLWKNGISIWIIWLF